VPDSFRKPVLYPLSYRGIVSNSGDGGYSILRGEEPPIAGGFSLGSLAICSANQQV